MKIIAIAVAALVLGGCATVTRGTTNQIQVVSEPSGAQVRTSTGLTCPSTPCTFEVPRKSEFAVIFNKDGYQELLVPVQTRIAGSGAAGFAGNVLIGGFIGMGVDAATGATLEHYPNPVMGQLVPIAPDRSPSRLPGKNRKRTAPPVVAPRPADGIVGEDTDGPPAT